MIKKDMQTMLKLKLYFVNVAYDCITNVIKWAII